MRVQLVLRLVAFLGCTYLLIFYHPHLAAVFHRLWKKTENFADPTKARDGDGIHLVTVIPFLFNESGQFPTESYTRRQEEFVETLTFNLVHPLVLGMYLLTPELETLERFLLAQHLPNRHISIHQATTETMDEPFQLISNLLVGKFAMEINADVYLGSGFEKIDYEFLKTNKVVYSLTRYNPLNISTSCQLDSYTCAHKYVGSHDSFMWYVRGPLDQTFLADVSVPYTALGVENRIIWAFQHILNYTVSNPCNDLVTYHNHCWTVRTGPRMRVNREKSGSAPFIRLKHKRIL